MKAYKDEDDGTLKKFSHKQDITKDLFYNVFCGDVAQLSSKLPKKEYSLLVADIPYGFRMAGYPTMMNHFDLNNSRKW